MKSRRHEKKKLWAIVKVECSRLEYKKLRREIKGAPFRKNEYTKILDPDFTASSEVLYWIRNHRVVIHEVDKPECSGWMHLPLECTLTQFKKIMRGGYSKSKLGLLKNKYCKPGNMRLWRCQL